VHLSVAAVRQPVKVAALPSHQALEAGIQRSCDGANLTESDLIQPSVLDEGNDSTRNSRSDGQVSLSQLAADPHRPQSGADLLVVHPEIMGDDAYPPIIRGPRPHSRAANPV
jgi:hypothetical protein